MSDAVIAYVFPGQGSQKVGMGKLLAQNFEVARRTFEEADNVLGEPLAQLIFEGDPEKLTLTANAQPAILCTSIAALRVAEEALPSLHPAVMAGHSLGEWTALVAAGALRFADAVRLVRERGLAMQDAVPPGEGAMAAIMGLAQDKLEAVCAEVSAALGQVVSPANFNGGDQVVISGAARAVDKAVARCREVGAKRTIKLPVSAPFHCALMEPAARRVEASLQPIEIGPMRCPVIANATALPNADPAKVKELLVKQVTGTVRWESSMQLLPGLGVTRVIEFGAEKVVPLIKRIVPGLFNHVVDDPLNLEALKGALA
jgi:[acyl-carrier-protein] S-malonyltransferase